MSKTAKTNSVLKKLYYQQSGAPFYSGAKQLVFAAKEHGISRPEVLHWLSAQDAYTLHKKVVRKYRTRRYTLLGIDDLWQLDLADMQGYAKENDGFKFWLVVIDTFSKFLWVRPVRNKSAKTVAETFEAILLQSGRKPNNINTDKGTEFVNSIFAKLLGDQNIHFYTAQNPDTKACFAERVIRTIKERVFRYLTHKNTKRYIDNLAEFVSSYNDTIHRSIKMKPSEVSKQNEDEVARHLEVKSKENSRLKFTATDNVRITKGLKVFRKGYEPSWTEEVFVVKEVHATDPPTYQLQDQAGEDIMGRFYENELQKVRMSKVFKVETVLKRRKKGGISESLVKWLGYPLTMASWIPTSEITNI